MLVALPLIATWVLTSADPRLAQADRLIADGDCDGLVTLFAKVERGAPDRDVSYARALVQGANVCRKEDAVLALALTDRALGFAPQDYGVTTAHAESLLSLAQRTEASELLERTIRLHPEGAIKARYLRAELADAEHEPERVVQVLAPIAQDPEYGARARTLLEKSRATLEARERDRAAVRTEEARLAQARKAAEATATGPFVASGTEVWSARATVKSGASRVFKTKGLQAGLSYELIAVGQCVAPKKRKKKGVRDDASAQLFGTDFRVSVGGQAASPLKVGFTAETSRVLFRAPHDNPQIHIEDRSFDRAERTSAPVKCTIGDLAVRTP